MAVNCASLNRVDNTVDLDFIIYQIGKGRCIIELEVGDLVLRQIEFFEPVVGKIAIAPFRIDVVDIPVRSNRRSRSLFSDNRRLAHAERTGKDPCRHGQGCKNPAQLQLFGFGTRLFTAPLIAVISVCHRKYLLSVLPFSISSSF